MRGLAEKLVGSSREAACGRLFWVLWAVAVGHLLVFFWLGGIRRIVSLVPDDCGYYFEVAENIVSGRGMTFDGRNPTNGFHPLWMVVLVGVQAAYRAAPETMTRVYLALQAAMLGAAAAIIYRVNSRVFAKSVCLVAGIVYLGLVLIPAANGMESALLVLLLSLVYAFALRGGMLDRPGPARCYAFGLLLGLCLLARLDTIFLPLAVGGFYLVRILRRRASRRADVLALAMIAAGCVTLLGPYLFYNKLTFGACMPISGALKSSFPHVRLSTYAWRVLQVRYRVALVFVGLYLLWFLARGRRGRSAPPARRRFRIVMAIGALAVLLHFAHTLLFIRWAAQRWHFLLYVLVAVMASADLAHAAISWPPLKPTKPLYWAGVAVVVLLGGFIVALRLNRPLAHHWQVVAYDAALWAQEHTGADDVFALKDAGIFGYYSRRSVVNLDGVVNNMEYQEALKAGRLNAYLRDNRVRFLMQPAFPGRDDVSRGTYETFAMRYESKKYPGYGDEVVLRKADEVYRSRPYRFLPDCTSACVIWDLRNAVP